MVIFNIRVCIRNFTLIALINSSALINFILIKIVLRLKLKTELKEELYSLNTVNKEPINEIKGLIYIETEGFYIIHYKTRHIKWI
jgi:hypothetical protein